MFTEPKVKQVMDSLQQVFASEAHFQLAFALQAKELFGKQFEYYPEVPVRKDSKVKKRDEFDLLVQDEKSIKTLIEFKYKTRNYPANSKTHKPIVFTLRSGTQISLANHLAQNNGYYDSWSDIQRIEEYVENGAVRNGFFILLTNDWRYWDGKPGELKTAFDGMYMHDGLHKAGERRFTDSDKKDHGGRVDSKTIKNDYRFQYTDYHYTPIPQQGDERYLKFKYLIVSVGS